MKQNKKLAVNWILAKWHFQKKQFNKPSFTLSRLSLAATSDKFSTVLLSEFDNLLFFIGGELTLLEATSVENKIFGKAK